MCSILIVDPDAVAGTDIAEELRRRGHDVQVVASGADAVDGRCGTGFDLIVADGEATRAEELALLRHLLRQDSLSATAFLIARSTMDPGSIGRDGAYQYLAKQLSPEDAEVLLERVAAFGARDGGHPSVPGWWKSANMRMARAVTVAQHVAAADVPVLLTGESGTGKKFLAAAMHRWGRRPTAPFATVWCAELGTHRLDRSLVDHLNGAVTGVPLDECGRPTGIGSGTLFFDEIGEGALPSSLQTKLLHHLETVRCGSAFGEARRETAARIIAATRHDLEDDVRRGYLREELLCHFNAITIHLPPLRDRPEDVPLLCDHFLRELAIRHGREGIQLTADAKARLAAYEWPGNVRELFTVLERAMVLTRETSIGADDVFPGRERVALAPLPSLSLMDVEREHIARALEKCATMGEAAAKLGIDPATLWRKRKRYGLTAPPSFYRRGRTARHD